MFLTMMLYLLLVLVRPQEYPGLVDSALAGSQPFILILAAVLWLFSSRKHFDAPQYALLLGFLLVLMLSNVVNGWFGGALAQISRFAPVVLAFVVLANAADTRAKVVRAMAMFTLSACVLAIHGIDQSANGIGWTGVPLSQDTRIQYLGIFNDPNDLGMLFVMCLPMAVHLSRGGGWMGLRRVFWLVAAGLLLYGVVLTDSRGTFLAVLAMVGVHVWKRRGVVWAALMAGAGLLVMLAMPSRMQTMDVSEASALGRVDSWYEGLQMFRANPLLGVGADMYSEYHHLAAHNSLVLVLAETGVVGFTVWIAFVGYSFRMMLAGSRAHPVPEAGRGQEPQVADASDAPDDADPAIYGANAQAAHDDAMDRGVAATLLLSLSGFFVAAFFLSRSYIVILYLLAALAVAHYSAMRRRNPSLPEFRLQDDLLRWPAISVGGIIVLYVGVKALLSIA